MWLKIFQICSIYIAIEEVNSIPVYMNYCRAYELIFHEQCITVEIIVEIDDSVCEMTLKDDTLGLMCSSRHKHLNKFEASCNMDKEALDAYYCIAQEQGYIQTTLHCENSTKYEPIFKNCNSKDVYSITMNEINPGDIYSAPNVPNLKHLNYKMYEECHSVCDIIKSLKHLERLFISIFDYRNFDNCQLLYFCNLRQLRELHIFIRPDKFFHDSEEGTVELSFANKFLKGMTNLELLKLKGALNNFDIQFNIDERMFQGLGNLTEIIFQNCIVYLTPKHFRALTNLKSLQLINVPVYQFDWLSSKILQHSLEYLEVNNAMPEYENFAPGFQYLENYSSLGMFDISFSDQFYDMHFIYNYNITAFICSQGSSSCIFISDIHKKPCPLGCRCNLDRPEMRFKIYCDDMEKLKEIPELPIPIIGNASLYFNNKSLTELPDSTLSGYFNLRELHVADNKFTHLTVAQLPPNLTYLDLRNNSLKALDNQVLEFLSSRSDTIRLRLSANPWNCNCAAADLISFVANVSHEIEDRESIKCFEESLGQMVYVTKTHICGSPTNYIVIGCGCLLGFAFFIMAYLYFKKSIIIWLYERNLCLSYISHPECDNPNGEMIDAFLAFSHMDSKLVQEYIEKLEDGPREFQLCYYQRDWLIGESIPACILKTIEGAKRIIILMTKNFIQSSWGRFEFRMAIHATSIDQNKRLIIIVYPEVEDFSDLDSELRIYMKLNTYLKRDDPQFWRKLIFAMPHSQVQKGKVDPTDNRNAVGQ